MTRWLRSFIIGAAFLLPGWAQAQLLDFDSVCATAPCAIGTLYAASGVTFSPATSQIVAAGTSGLTGTNGGKYLSIATFPYQTTITLGRQATFATLNLSRASTSSGTVTVQVTALKAGSPVGNTTVTLTTVNTWSTATFSIAGGFDSLFLDPAGGANLTFGIDNVRFGGTCNGFSDVSPSDSFCNATEWLANRSITLGCVAGQYCPTGNVTRAQMALFMQRLGNALTPTLLRAEQGFNNIDVDLPNQVFCQTAPFVAPGYPSTALATGSMAVGLNAAGTVVVTPVLSVDGGATWSAMTVGSAFNSGGFVTRTAGSTTQNDIDSASLNSAPIALVIGNTYVFGARLSRFQGTGDVWGANCGLTVEISNRTTTTAPFDANAQAAGVGLR